MVGQAINEVVKRLVKQGDHYVAEFSADELAAMGIDPTQPVTIDAVGRQSVKIGAANAFQIANHKQRLVAAMNRVNDRHADTFAKLAE